MAPTSVTDYTLPDDDARLCVMLARRPMLQRLSGIRLADTPQQPYDRPHGPQRLPVCWDVTWFSDPEEHIQASMADRYQAYHSCGKVER